MVPPGTVDVMQENAITRSGQPAAPGPHGSARAMCYRDGPAPRRRAPSSGAPAHDTTAILDPTPMTGLLFIPRSPVLGTRHLQAQTRAT